MATEEKGQDAAPEESINQVENFALTGFFSDGRKRIDIVLVFKDNESDKIKEMCFTFLMNIIKFGLEAEIEPGKMPEHKNLTFVKVHAPDAIIEECGMYFNEKSWFKDSHLEFINPTINIFAVANERELIKIARKQYPGPANYSTLERSNIVYKILLQLPFGKYKNYFGVNKLVENGIIQDVFALHDGPYFIVPKQSDVNMNARQVLFFEWLGMVNFWKWQPIHMIHEYFGKRISYYFAFYEYFNFMLVLPLIIGVWATVFMYTDDMPSLYYRNYDVCNTSHYTCPECRNFTLCPTITSEAYCAEFEYIKKIDRKETYQYGYFLAVWGVFFLIPWLYRERYLSWIWEENRKYTNELLTTEYKEPEKKTENEIGAKNGTQDQKTNKKEGSKIKKGITNFGCLLKKLFIYILILTCLVLWAIFLFKLSIVIWHYPRWVRFHGNAKDYVYKYGENINLAIGAGVYTIIVFFLKMGFMVLAQKITRYENNKTYFTYQRSIASKMYAISFIGSFTILIMYTYLGFVQVHLRNMKKPYHFMFGYGMMNSGYGSTLDDIGITVFVITTLEHVIFRMPSFMKGKTDYPAGFDSRVPCWEREYKLKPMNEFLFHKRYNDLAMQFAIITCFSMLFPAASMFLFIMNIWDMRYFARQLLLEYRRPLLINTSGPGFWKHLILITALYAQFSNTSIQVSQSFTFVHEVLELIDIHFIRFEKVELTEIIELGTPYEDYQNMVGLIKRKYWGSSDCVVRRFNNDMCHVLTLERQIRHVLIGTVSVAAIGLFLYYVIPTTSNSLEHAIKEEQLIKNKYQTRRTCALLNEST